jgi:hypothetical protein
MFKIQFHRCVLFSNQLLLQKQQPTNEYNNYNQF